MMKTNRESFARIFDAPICQQTSLICISKYRKQMVVLHKYCHVIRISSILQSYYALCSRENRNVAIETTIISCCQMQRQQLEIIFNAMPLRPQFCFFSISMVHCPTIPFPGSNQMAINRRLNYCIALSLFCL